MSLINQMLQDLDARGASSADGPMLVKPVPQARPAPRLLRRVARTLGLLALPILLILLVWGAWSGWRARLQPQSEPQRQPQTVQGPLALAPVPAGMVRVTPPQPAPAAPVPAPAAPVTAPVPAPEPVSAPLPTVAATRLQRAAPAAPAALPAARIPATAPRPILASAPVPESVMSAQAASRDSGTRSAEPSGARTSEAAYRRALADLQEGRVTDAIATLVRLLETDPRHDGARQTLVGLLVEAGRGEEALEQAQRALALDLRQPAMAMLAARLQLALRLTGAVDTLLRTLPYAQGNGDYQAFLAGALQRQQRHGEAVLQYQAALAATPGNPVWLMGLGISLQAEQRLAQARAAFQQAGASATLAPDLQAFVERRLQQLQQPRP